MFLNKLKKIPWQMECECVPCRVMTVQIGFSHKESEQDETEFSIKAWDKKELVELFEGFCKENSFHNVTILSVSVIRIATTMEELVQMESEQKVDDRTADMIEEVIELHNNTPNGEIMDADTILVDLIQNSDHEFTGFAQDVFNIWKGSADKKAVEQMFYEFTDMEFDRYLMKCKEEISR